MNMKKTKGNKSPDRIFEDSSQGLFRLLAHHPHFIQGITAARKKYGIREYGVKAMLDWKSRHRQNKYHDLIADIGNLMDGFTLPPQLYSAGRRFAEDYVFLNRHDTPTMFAAGLNVIRPTAGCRTFTLNPNAVYVEVIPGATSEREVRENWKRIVGNVRQSRKLSVPKINPLEERVWELVEKKGKKAAAEQLRVEYPRRSFTYADVNKHLGRYKSVLSKLRPVK